MLLLDVDGVLTDGTFQRIGDLEIKRFHSRDGIGLVLAQRAGWKVGIISGRNSPQVEERSRELKLDFVRLGVEDKLACFKEALETFQLEPHQVAYMGDDLPDLEVLSRVGLSATVADAHDEIRSRVLYVTRAPGGHGAVREFVDQLLLAQGKLEELIKQYSR